jgi:molybdopterin molybdotransferase
MIEYHEALRVIWDVANRLVLPVENIPLLQSVGRVCATELKSNETIPPYANSSMDGFAVQSVISSNASPTHPLRFKVVGRLAAGDSPPKNPSQNGVWEIMTGAPFPEGFDATVKIEDTLLIKNSVGEVCEIEINSPVLAKQNWRGSGEDFSEGSVVVRRGMMIRSEHILALSSLGIIEVPAYRPIKVGLISTGRELVPMDQKPSAGQIRNSTAPYIMAALKSAYVDIVHL